ncbi:MAG: polysaccharide deacetylase family protein [Niameybacter sp.]|uniref:polysaccharide deacetylase family protein n=1 Tax=Niameybacter sp. TaxID=2033640 RepID=UPI002FC9D1C3
MKKLTLSLSYIAIAFLVVLGCSQFIEERAIGQVSEQVMEQFATQPVDKTTGAPIGQTVERAIGQIKDATMEQLIEEPLIPKPEPNKAKASDKAQETLKEEEKVVYLTFDDGPTGKVTEKILDVLKAHDIKATFFVVGKEIIQRESVLKRIYEEGHSIGLHTYSHNLKSIYASDENFLAEMEKATDKIHEVLGTTINPKIIRFPGGSSGRLSEDLLNKLHEEGYKIYDWNVSLEDGVNPNLTPNQMVQNAKKCSRNTTRRIILAHCNSSNKNTYNALPEIINYYKSQGYVFKPIDEKTQEFYYRIKTKK